MDALTVTMGVIGFLILVGFFWCIRNALVKAIMHIVENYKDLEEK